MSVCHEQKPFVVAVKNNLMIKHKASQSMYFLDIQQEKLCEVCVFSKNTNDSLYYFHRDLLHTIKCFENIVRNLTLSNRVGASMPQSPKVRIQNSILKKLLWIKTQKGNNFSKHKYG